MTDTIRHHRGKLAYHAGASAEDTVARAYVSRGCDIAGKRWRGKGGEIDLIVRDNAGLIFVEVKKARDFDRAAHSLSARQMQRICGAAEEYIGTEPTGSLTQVRFDVALVDGVGQMRIIENAFGHG